MPLERKLMQAAALVLVALAAHSACAADKAASIAKLNQAAKSFHTTSADFQFVTEQTEPVPDTDTQIGSAYYERDGRGFKMAAHIETDNQRPAKKIYTFSDGVFKLFEVGINQVTTFQKASKFADYIMLGFGASGDELAAKWDIVDLGPETAGGVQTEKLELTAKDPTVRKNLPKVTIWIDLSRAVSLKQVFDEGQGQTRTCTYSNIKTNQPLPKDAFTFMTDKKTQFVNR
jgi:outer membrane lipoprotein-sorting protein